MTATEIVRAAMAEAEAAGDSYLKPLPVHVVRDACAAAGTPEARQLANAVGRSSTPAP